MLLLGVGYWTPTATLHTRPCGVGRDAGRYEGCSDDQGRAADTLTTVNGNAPTSGEVFHEGGRQRCRSVDGWQASIGDREVNPTEPGSSASVTQVVELEVLQLLALQGGDEQRPTFALELSELVGKPVSTSGPKCHGELSHWDVRDGIQIDHDSRYFQRGSVDLTYLTFSCGAGSPNPSTN